MGWTWSEFLPRNGGDSSVTTGDGGQGFRVFSQAFVQTSFTAKGYLCRERLESERAAAFHA